MNANASALIRTTPALEEACAASRSEGILALDTEFVWTSTYRPRLGLVQFGCRAGAWALDCQAGLHPDALGALVADPSCVKILHDCRQDLVHIRHYAGTSPRNVFDTQLAAAFAGFRSGIGLQSLLFDAIGVGLPKTETLTDWTRRPLSDAQIDYALDDVRYLPDLRDELIRRADGFETRAWMEAEMRKFDDPVMFADYDPQSGWKRIKTGRARLEPRGFAILRAVAAVREELAQRMNVPRGWLADDPSLVQMAVDRRVGRFRHRLGAAQADVARRGFEAAIADAMSLPEDECPENPRPRYIQEVVEAADEAYAWMCSRAEALHVDPTAVASRATVVAFVDDVENEENPLATGWRGEAFGAEMASRFGVD